MTKPSWEEATRQSAKFANFAQRIKMAYWETLRPGQTHVAEYLIDELLLVVFEEINKYKK